MFTAELVSAMLDASDVQKAAERLQCARDWATPVLHRLQMQPETCSADDLVIAALLLCDLDDIPDTDDALFAAMEKVSRCMAEGEAMRRAQLTLCAAAAGDNEAMTKCRIAFEDFQEGWRDERELFLTALLKRLLPADQPLREMIVRAAQAIEAAAPRAVLVARAALDEAITHARSIARAEHARFTTTTMTSKTTAHEGEQAIPVVQEELEVGKRQVRSGQVRVRSFVVETPVQEQVILHDEHTRIERRPVDRPVGADAFQEKTIEVTQAREEPVVSKTARITEEVVVGKRVETHTETVSGTVRRTEVEIEDERSPRVSGQPDPKPMK